MAKIVILTHARDKFSSRPYLVAELAQQWRAAGHDVSIHSSPGRLPRSNVTILHVDRTVVPGEYLEAARNAELTINLSTVDISKRRYSRQLVRAATEWEGAVFVKTNLNCAGLPEAHARTLLDRALNRLSPKPRFPRKPEDHAYRVFERSSDVPRDVWSNPDLVVEKFLPEQDESGYYLRTWIFFGDRECCNRVRSASPIVKGHEVSDRTPVPVPDALRSWRRELGFDYGKFDFVIHEGNPVLFDANRTPTAPLNLRASLESDISNLSRGIDSYL
jgi:hypothetical protein